MNKESDVLMSAQDSSSAIRELFRALKAENPRASLQQICNRAGIPSKGNLADVMSGTRVLKLEYAQGLAEALGLNRLQAQYLLNLVRRDRAGTEGERKQAQSRLDQLSKSMLVEQRALPEGGYSPRLLMKSFCAIGLFEAPPTLDQVAGKLEDESKNSVKLALDCLLATGIVEIRDGKIQYRSKQISFGGASNLPMQILHIRESLHHAEKVLEKWYPRRAESFFLSTQITVKDTEFRRILAEFRDACERTQSELESEKPDRLISFNVQVYPSA